MVAATQLLESILSVKCDNLVAIPVKGLNYIVTNCYNNELVTQDNLIYIPCGVLVTVEPKPFFVGHRKIERKFIRDVWVELD